MAQITWRPLVQRALQTTLGLPLLSLFVFVSPLRFAFSCMAPIFFILISLNLAGDAHVGSRVFASCLLAGSAVVGSVLAACVLCVANLCTGPLRVVLKSLLSALVLGPLCYARVGPAMLVWAQGLMTCLMFVIVVLLGQGSADDKSIWIVAVSYLFSGALTCSAMSFIVAVLVMPSFNGDEAHRCIQDILRKVAINISKQASLLFGPPSTPERDTPYQMVNKETQQTPTEVELSSEVKAYAVGGDQDLRLTHPSDAESLSSVVGSDSRAPRNYLRLTSSASELRAILSQARGTLFSAKLEPPWLRFLRVTPCWPLSSMDEVVKSLTAVVNQMGSLEAVFKDYDWRSGDRLRPGGAAEGMKEMEELLNLMCQVHAQVSTIVVLISDVLDGQATAVFVPGLITKLRTLQARLTASLAGVSLGLWSSHQVSIGHPPFDTAAGNTVTERTIINLVFCGSVTGSLSSAVTTLAEQVYDMWLSKSVQGGKMKNDPYRGEDLRLILGFCLGMPVLTYVSKASVDFFRSLQTSGWSSVNQLLRQRTFQAWMKYWLTVTLALVITLVLNHLYPRIKQLQIHYFVIYVIAVLWPKVESSVARFVFQVIGVLTGVGLGYLVMGNEALVSTPAVVPAIFTVLTFPMMLLLGTRWSSALFSFLVSFQSMTFCVYKTPSCCGYTHPALVEYTLGRIVSMILGCLTALLVSNFVFPWYYSSWVLDVLASVCTDSSRLLRELYDRFVDQYIGEVPQQGVQEESAVSGAGKRGTSSYRMDSHALLTVSGHEEKDGRAVPLVLPAHNEIATVSSEGFLRPLPVTVSSAEVPRSLAPPSGEMWYDADVFEVGSIQTEASFVSCSSFGRGAAWAEGFKVTPTALEITETSQGMFSKDTPAPGELPSPTRLHLTSPLLADIQSQLAGPMAEVKMSLSIETVPWDSGSFAPPAVVRRLYASLEELLNMDMGLYGCLNMDVGKWLPQETWVARSHLTPLNPLHQQLNADLEALFTAIATILREDGNLEQHREAGRNLLAQLEADGARLRDQFLMARKALEGQVLTNKGQGPELVQGAQAALVHYLTFIYVYGKSLGQLYSIAKLVVEEEHFSHEAPCCPL